MNPSSSLPLFADAAPESPDWLTRPQSVIEWAFKRFHEHNPVVYQRLEQAALAWAKTSPKRVGVKRLVENLRYARLALDDTFWREFKLDNRYTALYARLLIYRHPHLAEVIELRVRREPGATIETGVR